MIKIKVTNLSKQIKAIKDQIAGAANKEYRRQVLIMFNDLVRHSPQWSGDFASNWWVSQTPGAGSYNPSPFKGHTSSAKTNIHKLGDFDSIANTIRRANSLVVNYNKPTYFMNYTPVAFLDVAQGEVYAYGENQPYPGAKMSAHTKVRAVNLVDGSIALGAYLKARYSAV